MAETPRNLSQLLALYADNTAGEISAADLRDGVASSHPEAGSIHSVKNYGAKGDGQTDDSAAILAARDAVNAAGGGVLYFPRGTFILSQTIALAGNTTVLGTGAASVLRAKAGTACFNMLRLPNKDNVCVRELVLDGNRSQTTDVSTDEELGCGMHLTTGAGQVGLSLRDLVICNHHRNGIRVVGPTNSDDPYQLAANEVEVLGCQIRGCGSRGVFLVRVTRARVAGNVVKNCVGVGIQLGMSRGAVVDGNNVTGIVKRAGAVTGGSGIFFANSVDYSIVNNVTCNNDAWGIVASGGVGQGPPAFPMCRRYTVANNICRANGSCGITIDPQAATQLQVIQDSFATVSSNVCTENGDHGINVRYAGHVVVRGNVCEANSKSGIQVGSCHYVLVADNSLTNNGWQGVGFSCAAATEVQGPVGHHFLGLNVYDNNKAGPYKIDQSLQAMEVRGVTETVLK